MASRLALRLQRLQQLSILRNCHSRSLRCLVHIPNQPALFRPRYYSDDSTSSVTSSTPSTSPSNHPAQPPVPLLWIPPEQCPGCGAPCQQVDPELPGYYPIKPPKPKIERKRKKGERRVKKPNPQKQKEREEEALRLLQQQQQQQGESAKPAEETLTEEPAVDVDAQDPSADNSSWSIAESVPEPSTNRKKESPPLCRRCRDIHYHHDASSLPAYPTLKTLSSLLLSSRHKHNHIYHLIDAADFPLSLYPGLRNYLYKTLPKQITHNLTISYIITRSDVLFPQREQISSLMTYFKSVLKSALPEGEKVEGHDASTKLHVISSRRGWDVGILKSEITKRQGGVWFLGGVNVGKSSLLRDIWPVDGELRPVTLEDAAEFDILPTEADSVLEGQEQNGENHASAYVAEEQQTLDELLSGPQVSEPPAKITAHVAPTISAFPGTTAAPIRVSFKSIGRAGKYRGEVVDLPGLERWVGFKGTGINRFVRPDKRKFLLLKERPNPEQYTIKPGQSMLLGGLIMVTPKTPDMVVLANPFTNLPVHIASTQKCIRFLANEDPANALPDERLFQDAKSIAAYNKANTTAALVTAFGEDRASSQFSELPPAYASAGIFTLSDDVTTYRNPRLPTRSPEAIAELPYKVLATDILLEGIGWVELTAQVRNRRDTGYQTVDVEVFTPEGKGVGQRRTMNAYSILEEGARARGLLKKTAIPRKSMKGQKKLMKQRIREGRA
ncbi:hypothetical protein FN846DRAFT_889090 [Sphaerosporella brunnea]|uniref:G domain-containing protein n=1 Tax=Sphaerosporella brunnea TaxID=1250544 RepID=A0A5J5F0F1_9PEZI|nr:hypothetical protein FN846DRAFT_889090 [Sphaerosporella brunnea]